MIWNKDKNLKIRFNLKRKNIKIVDIAKLLKCTATNVHYKISNGTLTLREICIILDHYKIKYNDLFGGLCDENRFDRC